VWVLEVGIVTMAVVQIPSATAEDNTQIGHPRDHI
jgi:hypothetical protein